MYHGALNSLAGWLRAVADGGHSTVIRLLQVAPGASEAEKVRFGRCFVGPSVALAKAARPHANGVMGLRLEQTTSTEAGVRGLAI